MHHETSNADTSRRIRRTVRNRFLNGAALRPPIYGYLAVHYRRNVCSQEIPLAHVIALPYRDMRSLAW